MDKIFYVTAINLRELTKEDLRKKYESYKILYDKKDWTYDKFLEYIKSWKEDKYSIDSFISSYHLSKEEAIKYATNNYGDINEAGCYNYAAVSTAPIGCTYYNSEQNPREDFIIYKYNLESGDYKELSKDAKEYKALISHVWGFIGGQ